jgi:2-dehydro-3-deoxyphosphogalactonate aldolase
VARSDRAGLLASIFSTRALALVDSLPAAAQPDYLSGLLIGHELRGLEELDRHALDAGRIVLSGGEELCVRYRRVLAGMGRRGVEIARHATARGLWSIARAAGLVDDAGGGSLREALAACGLIAILRGIQPGEAEAAGAALYAAGLRAIEVPLNSPDPLASIRALRASLPAGCAVGAGTVMTAAQVDDVRAAGGEFIVMPHADPSVIRAARRAGLEVAPGVATAGEAFAAVAAGADLLKMFPAGELGAGMLAAWRAVLPAELAVIPVGGIDAGGMPAFVAAGAAGFGLGSAIYRPGMAPDEIGRRAAAMVAAWRAAQR